jgi:hypothetical protein
MGPSNGDVYVGKVQSRRLAGHNPLISNRLNCPPQFATLQPGWQSGKVGEKKTRRNSFAGSLIREVFAIGMDYQVYADTQRSNGTWSGWFGLPVQQIGGFQSIAVGRNADGRLALVGIDWNNSVYTSTELVAGGPFSDWFQLGKTNAASVSLAALPDGRLEIFELGLDGSLAYLSQALDFWFDPTENRSVATGNWV